MKIMKRIISALLLVIMLCSAVLPCVAVEAASGDTTDNVLRVDRVYTSNDADKKATNDSLLEKLMPKYETLKTKITNKESGYSLGTASSSIGTPDPSWTAEVPELRADHPRLLVTKETLPTVKKALQEDNATNSRFFELLDAVPANDGALGAATVDFKGIKGKHNYDDEILEIIQVKALGYLVDGHELYGRQAIYYMKQFLRTLDIQYINSCQERQYGNTAFTAALVYDWCYDLLSPQDKRQLIAGVENKTLKGYCGDPSYTSAETHKRKMTVDFPPSDYNAIAGSGAEREILRDSLSVAIAFYGDMSGDNKSWWNYISKLVYSELVPVRNYYFQSGISHQGTGVYIYGRHLADMYSAWMLQTATGTQPYKNLDKTIRNFLGYECAPGDIFSDGDGTLSTKRSYKLKSMAYISAYLFADEPMLAQARDMLPSRGFKNDTIELTSAMYVALCGMSDIQPAEDKYEGMSLIQYNGSPVGQYLVHQAWDDPNSANVMMKIKERNAGGHEHMDSGTFMIYYKGMLTADGGVYNQSTSNHTKYYHQATVSHNGILIYDPSKADTSSTNAATKYYSGSQKKPSVLNDRYEDLKSNDYLMGKVIGRSHGYYDAAQTQPKYAYIGGNLTSAYAENTTSSSFTGRRMLTVYTGDEDVPMVFFTYDTITTAKSSYVKKYLLQICSPDAPTINTTKKTVTTENGDGRLVLTCLTDGVKFEAIGGRTLVNGSYSSTSSKNYSVNGLQIATTNNYDDGKWGRVELSLTGAPSHKMLNAIYVTDKGNTTYYETKPITNVSNNILSGGDVEGGVFNGSVAAIFVKRNIKNSTNFVSGTISFTTEGKSQMSYYVDGLAGGAGKWRITVNGKYIDSVIASNGFITFDAPAGNVVLTKESENLSNKKITYINKLGTKLENNDYYTAESYAAYCEAYDAIVYSINAAVNIAKVNEIDVATLKAAAERKLVATSNGLVNKKADMLMALGPKIQNNGEYTQSSYEKYSATYDAMVDKINLADDIGVLHTIDIDSFKQTEEKNLSLFVDDRPSLKMALFSEIVDAMTLSKNNYTSDSWAVLQSALENANLINNDANATREQILSATSSLVAASKALEKAEAPAKSEDPAKTGCGSSIALSSLTLVGIFGTALLIKRREE